jgi:hypothetical protein
MDKTQRKLSKKAHELRQKQQEGYNEFNVEPTEVNGTPVRSRLEALWIEELSDCDSFKCVECVKVPVWIDGPYGKILGNYQPDLLIETAEGKILVELKPTKKLALIDDRPKRALELNPKMKFMVVGGYPYSQRGVTVRLLTGDREKVYNEVNVCQVLEFLGCNCEKEN